MAHFSHRVAEKFGNFFCCQASKPIIVEEKMFIEGFDQILQLLHRDQLARFPHEIGLQVAQRIAAVHVGQNVDRCGRKDEVVPCVADSISNKKHFLPGMLDLVRFESISEFGMVVLCHA